MEAAEPRYFKCVYCEDTGAKIVDPEFSTTEPCEMCAAEPPSNVDGPAEGRRWIVEESDVRNGGDFIVTRNDAAFVVHTCVKVIRELEPITEAGLDCLVLILRDQGLPAVLRECGLTVEGK
jgi:hypothetical protein